MGSGNGIQFTRLGSKDRLCHWPCHWLPDKMSLAFGYLLKQILFHYGQDIVVGINFTPLFFVCLFFCDDLVRRF